ncbi:hypothetical protein EV641_106161 [Rhodococcus sp. SMB37]|uniref:hypothetical protein n=1 Tax=Rhodococcus sp. SMB37 TaxID=2512213 RepID=UPI0010E611D6|nr:hypothetical protein [Rhodococcus sp. SMB37]TCN53516.1 hypothetical protein EV641_106161 [Rhodococcus sp. SMB37]
MSIWCPGDTEQLTWRFRVVGNAVDFYDKPGAELDVPDAWIDAVVATGRHLRCLRYGRDVDPDRLIWELSISPTYAVTIGWHGTAGISGFGLCRGLSMNTSFVEAAVWVADTAQTELAGYDFVQWPSRGRHLLRPRQVDGAPVWIDLHGDRWCRRSANCAATPRLGRAERLIALPGQPSLGEQDAFAEQCAPHHGRCPALGRSGADAAGHRREPRPSTQS